MRTKFGQIVLATALLLVLAALAYLYEQQRSGFSDLSRAVAAIKKGMLSSRDLGHDRLDVRSFVIRSQLAQAAHPIVFIGDSITEAARLPSSICGRPVVNAGIGGTQVQNYGEVAADVIAAISDASLIVIALGTNDAHGKLPPNFREHYLALVRMARERAPNIVLVGVPPIENGAMAALFDAEDLNEINTTISKIAQDQSVEFADVRAAITSPHSTTDGVHLSPEGYKPWLDTITEAIGRSLNCKASPAVH